MELSAPITDANTNTPTVKMVSPDRFKPTTLGWTFWQSLAKRFWTYTEETGRADTRTFEGLL